jgi:hypothetical protein
MWETTDKTTLENGHCEDSGVPRYDLLLCGLDLAS